MVIITKHEKDMKHGMTEHQKHTATLVLMIVVHLYRYA